MPQDGPGPGMGLLTVCYGCCLRQAHCKQQRVVQMLLGAVTRVLMSPPEAVGCPAGLL
jgi:hypothetical protein